MNGPPGRLLRALTTLYLLIPAFLFAVGWLRLRLMAMELVALAVVAFAALVELYVVLRDVVRTRPRSALQLLGSGTFVGIGASLSLLGVWLLLSGTGGFGSQTADYTAHNALLHELMIGDWPIRLGGPASTKYVVYYLGYFLPAGAFGKLMGWDAANYFLLLQTFIGIALALAWFAKISRIRFGGGASRYVAVTAYFCLAGGLDLIGYYVLRTHPFNIATGIEFWADFFQYSSNTTLLYWAPQQAVAGWLITGMVADALLDGGDVRFLGPACAASILWTPLADVGVAPFLVVLLVSYLLDPGRRRFLFSPISLALNGISVWIAAVHLLYLAGNSMQLDFGPIWGFIQKPPLVLAGTLLEFWLIEFGLLAGAVCWYVTLSHSLPSSRAKPTARAESPEDPAQLGYGPSRNQWHLFLGCIAVLILLPLGGSPGFNDFVMRASIPALFLLWAFVAKVIADLPRPGTFLLRILRAFILLAVVIGFFPAISGIAASAGQYHVGPPPLSSVPQLTDLSTLTKMERVGFPDSFFFRYLGKQPQP